MSFPVAQLRVYNPDDLWGKVVYRGEHCTWDLISYFGQNGAYFAGFLPDPTGEYFIQTPKQVWVDAGTVQYTKAAGDTGTYSKSTGATSGKLFLFQSSATATAFDMTATTTRTADEGFSCDLYRADTLTGTLYLNFSAGRTAGTPGLRLAIETGAPIRLQVSFDNDASWTDVDTAYSLGNADAYLSGNGQRLQVDVFPQCDPYWAPSSDSPLPPPGRVVVSLGSDAVLQYAIPTVAAGSLRITGALGQWSLRYAKKRFVPTASASLPAVVRPTAFQGTPRGYVSGYSPYAGTVTGAISSSNGAAGSGGGVMQILAGNQATAALSVQTPTSGQETIAGTVYAIKTVFLSSVEAEWPSVQTAPLTTPPYVAYEPIYASMEVTYDQSTRMVRRRGLCIFQSRDNRYAPGSVLPAARAAQLLMGDISDAALTPVITGWTALAALKGQEWAWVDWEKHFAVVIEDRHRKGDDDQAACLHMMPFDFQPHYTPVRRLHYALGITDLWMNFPITDELGNISGGGTFGGYYLGGGTAKEPLWQPAPDEPINSFLLRIMEKAGEIDPVSGQIQPMVMGDSPDGHVVYTPIPAGIASAFLTPGQTLSQLGLTALRSYVLGDFLKGTLRTSATLSHIRTPIVVEGLDSNGNLVVGVAGNAALGGGSQGNSSVAGYIGTDVPYISINRGNSSLAVVQRAAAVAAVTMAFPAIGSEGTLGFLDPGMDILSVITLSDAYTQGNNGSPVPYWTNVVRHVVDGSDPKRRTGETSFTARLIGQAG